MHSQCVQNTSVVLINTARRVPGAQPPIHQEKLQLCSLLGLGAKCLGRLLEKLYFKAGLKLGAIYNLLNI